MTFDGSFGVHFLPHHPGWEHLTAPRILAMGDVADRGEAECIWFATRFLARDALTLMSMLAAEVETSLGTLVANPWGRNPLELASTLGVIGETLAPGRELRFGIGSGVSHSRWVDRPKPLRFVRETIEILRALLAGARVDLDRFTSVSEYFHLHGTASLSVAFSRPEAVSFWFALTGGPIGDRLAAEVADGIVLDAGTVMGLGSLVDGRTEEYAASIDERRATVMDASPLRRILNLCMSVSDDRQAAFAKARQHAAVATSRGVASTGSGSDEPTDADLGRSFVVGTPDEVIEQVTKCARHAARLGCEHIVLGVPTGPDPEEAIALASAVIIPGVRARMARPTSLDAPEGTA